MKRRANQKIAQPRVLPFRFSESLRPVRRQSRDERLLMSCVELSDALQAWQAARQALHGSSSGLGA